MSFEITYIIKQAAKYCDIAVIHAKFCYKCYNGCSDAQYSNFCYLCNWTFPSNFQLSTTDLCDWRILDDILDNERNYGYTNRYCSLFWLCQDLIASTTHTDLSTWGTYWVLCRLISSWSCTYGGRHCILHGQHYDKMCWPYHIIARCLL